MAIRDGSSRFLDALPQVRTTAKITTAPFGPVGLCSAIDKGRIWAGSAPIMMKPSDGAGAVRVASRSRPIE